jgi:formylmethanofuran dehydrogenase subunit B
VDAALIVGDAAALGSDLLAPLGAVPIAVIGPGASTGPLSQASVVIDTARAGVHEAGTALRLDEVPLPLRAVLDGPPVLVELVARLTAQIQ